MPDPLGDLARRRSDLADAIAQDREALVEAARRLGPRTLNNAATIPAGPLTLERLKREYALLLLPLALLLILNPRRSVRVMFALLAVLRAAAAASQRDGPLLLRTLEAWSEQHATRH